MNRLTRRKLLWGAAGVGLALPWLESLQPKPGRAAPARIRRVIFEFKPNGDEPRARFPNADPQAFELGEFLEPLTPYRSELLFLNQADKNFHRLGLSERGDNHQQGAVSLAPWQFSAGDFPVGGEMRSIGYVLGESADHALGSRVVERYPGLPHRHLVYRVGDRGNNIWNLTSHAGPAGEKNPVIPETDPLSAYTRLFGTTGDEAQAEVEHRLRLERSVLDLVTTELDTLTPRLSATDRARLQQHVAAMRDIERALVPPSTAGECNPVSPGGGLDPYDDANHVLVAEAFFKLIALTLACDLTRVVAFAWHGSTSQRVYRNLGLSEGHHDISHRSDAVSFANIRQIQRHLWTQSLKLYEELRATPDGDGSLWDSTLIVHWNELGQGDVHSTGDSLTVFAGGHDGYFQRGRLVDFGRSVAFSDLLLHCFHFMGFDDVESFGDPRLSNGSGPPSGLTA